MYPNLGGPFQSICEADAAIERYLDELRHTAMYGFLTLFKQIYLFPWRANVIDQFVQKKCD